jgi:hypothetical protein
MLSVRRPIEDVVLKLLGHRHERDLVRIEHLDDLGEVSKRPGEAVGSLCPWRSEWLRSKRFQASPNAWRKMPAA